MIALLPFIVAFLLTALVTPLSLVLIRRLGIFDDPKAHKHPAIIHKKPIPRGGGIPLFIGILITGILFLPLTSEIVIALFFASFISLVVGVIDDKFDISPYLRFFINIIVALIVVQSGVGIPFITNPFGGILYLNAIKTTVDFLGMSLIISLSDIVAIVWIVWVMNMLNWSKGVDGQMPGIVGISAFVIGVLSLRFPLSEQNTFISTVLSFAIAGSSFGFLLFNFYPAKIFPGYGATSVYLFLAVVSILSGAKLATAILVMGVPMVDGIFTILRRILSGRSPFEHDKKHLHHLLLGFGFSQRSIALFYWFISGIVGSISLLLSSKGKLFALIMVVVLVGGAILFLHLILNHNNDKKNI